MEITTAGTINFDPAMRTFGKYRALKAKYKQAFDDNMYSAMAWNALISMFKHDEKVYRPELFEKILHDFGVAALVKTPLADYTPVICNIVGGKLEPDGFMQDAICFDMSGHEYKFANWRENENILVFFNNFTYSADLFIDKYSYMLSEIDTSINCNVLYSRLKPVPIAKDGKSKNQIDAVISDLQTGAVKTILQDFDVSDVIVNNKPSIEVMNLSEVESSKYIQYLQHLHDSIISRLFFMMGLSINDTGKQAQITIDELNKSKSAALSLLNGWYEMRKRGYDDAEKKTGQQWEFGFSDVWRSEIETNEVDPDDVEINEDEPDNPEPDNPEPDNPEPETEGNDEST